MSDVWLTKPAQDQSSGSGHTVATSLHPYITDPIASKRICFYKSGDPQFSGLRMVINNRTFKTFDALLDSLSKKVPLPFGVRNITTPRGVHAVHTLDELEDGKAYICSDQQKVKCINMAVASKKRPPWYNARPMSARHRALQLAKQNPGRPMRKKTPVIVRTPKRLMIFRNGDPSVKHNLMLQKRTTPTFEALLDYVSELMHFPVVKLHTPDGRRVDGLPALILCSGIVVAAGREAFKSGNYKSQKSSAPTWLPARRMASKRLKQPASRKKKPVSSGKSQFFSPSSERYLVNQINHCIAGSQCDLPSNNAESVELEAGHFLESVAETDADTYHGDKGEGADNCMPGDDDIEKSFRVNQDGSMTVEMKVRLTIREEETIHWTTTLSRSSVANQLSVAESELGNSSPESNLLPPTQPNTMGTINGYNAKRDDHDDKDDMSPEASGLTSVEVDNEDDAKTQVDVVSPRRAPTPGPRRYRQKQVSVESIKTMLGDEIQENMVDSNSYRETTENGEVKEEYCMVRQCSSKPVPKPRGVVSVDINNYKTQSTFKSGVAEILQIQNGGEEVIESVMHIYEKQTCQDNFLANSQYSVQGVSMYGMMYGRPATSDTARFSSSNDLGLELGRPSKASKSISGCRADQSLASDFTIPKFKAGGSLQNNRVLNVHKTPLSKPTKDNDTPEWVSEASKENSTTGVKKVKKMFSKPKVKKNQVRKSTAPDKRRKESNANAPENNKRLNTGRFRSNVSIRKIYGPKPARSLIKNKLKGKEIKLNIENPKESSVKELNVSENRNKTSVSVKKNVLHVSFPTEAKVEGTLKRQRSMHEERKIEKESHDLRASMSQPALLSSSSNITEYVENWLEKALPTVYPDPVEETQNVETSTMFPVETEGDVVPDVSEFNCEMDTEEDESSFFKEKTQIPSSPSLETTAFPNRTFENIATQINLALENTTLPCPSDPSSQKTPLHSDTTQERLPINPSVEKTPFSNDLSVSPTTIISVEKPSPSDSHSLEEKSTPKDISEEKPPITNGLSLENKSVPNSSSIEKTPVSNSLSPEKTPLPAKTQTEKTPLSNKVLDVSSVACSPSYFMCSSPSSLGDEEQPLSSSHSSDEAQLPTGHVSEKTTLFNHSTLKETPSPKLSTKKTRLVSNLSLEKQLSLRKASAEKSSISSDPTVEKVLVDKAPISNGLSSEKTLLPAKTLISNVLDEAPLASSPSCFMSTSPTSPTSDERPVSICPSSEEALSPTGHVLEKTTLFNPSTLKGPSTPKLPMKKTRLISNLSLEKQLSLRRASVEKSSIPSNTTLEKAQLSNPVQITVEKTQLPNSHSLEETSLPNKSLPSDSTSENTQLSSSPRQGRTPLPRNVSLKTSLHNVSPEITTLPTTLVTRNKSAPSNLSSEKIPVPSNRTLTNRLLPYSQSLEIVSPPMSHKAKKKPVSRNQSLESKPPPVSPTLKTPISAKSTPVHLNSSMKKKPIPPSPALVNHEETNGDDKLSNSDQGNSTKVTAEEPLTKTQIPSHADKLPPQPDMKPLLEKLCFSIRSIRQITHNNHPSCLEKSNSLPDFSSHVASTFGSSTKALLSFLSVITLKESFTNWNIPELNANSVSCAEALKMMESLREIANIEDAEELKASLSELQKSTSTQLLQSWKGFQELNDKDRSRSSTPNSSEHNVLFETCPEEEYNIEEKALDIDELIHELDLPEKLKEALAALPTRVSESMEGDEIEMSKEANEKVESSPESTAVPKEEASNYNVLNNDANVDVKSIIKSFITIYHPKEVTEIKMSPIPESQSSRQEQPFSSEEQNFKEDFTCHRNRQVANKEGSELEQDNWEEDAKCCDKQIDHDEEQTFSEIEQAYSLALHDGYLEPQACPVETKEKDVDIQSSYVGEEESLEEEQEYDIVNALVEQENKCMELQLSNEDRESTAEQTQVSSNHHEESEVTLVELKVSSEEEESLEEGQEYYIENPHVEQEIKCMELQVSCKESLEEDQASSEEEQKCHVEDQLSHVESENTCMEEECLEEEQQCHIEDQPSCVGLQVSYEERVSTLEEQATSDEEHECHIEDQPNHEEPEVNCLALQDSSEDGKSTPEEDQAISDEELEHHVENQPNHEDPKIKCMDVKVSSEESMSSLEEAQASSEEELQRHIENQPSHEEKGVKCMEMQVGREEIEFTPEEDKAGLGEEEESHADDLSYANAHINVQDEQTHLWVEQTTQKETEYTVREILPSLFKQHSNADRMDKDSGKNSEQHVCFEQQTDTAEEANFEDNQCSSEEKQVSYEEKLSGSVSVEEPYPEEEYQETFLEEEPSEEDTHYEKTEAKTTNCFEEPLPSVAERVKLLDKKIADVEQRKIITIETTGIKPFGQIEVPAVSDGDDLTNVSHLLNEQAELDKLMEEASEMHTTNYVINDVKEQDKAPVHTFKRTTWPINTSETVVMSPPAPRSSSLAFSYDGCITREPDGNRVKSIKELFMAKSVVDIQYGQTRLPSPNTSDLSDNRPETSDSGGHRSQTSTETSSGEYDSVKKSITKGVVRRTIERLYGKKDTNVKDPASKSQHPSLLKPQSRELPSKISLSPFHNAQNKVISDLSYFNATSSFGTYSDPTRCIAFNAQVGPGDFFLIDKDRWLLRESVIRKSVSEPIDINKNTSASTEDVCKDTKEDPYSLFGHTDLEDIVKSVKPLVPKCTYFNLPHGCDSDPHQDDLSPVSAKGDVSKDSKDKAEEPKQWAEKNGTLPAFAPTDFKMPDNKVHPLIEGPGGGKVVVVQPGKRQPGKGQTDVKKIPQEPDALEMLYFSCGQHCPIL